MRKKRTLSCTIHVTIKTPKKIDSSSSSSSKSIKSKSSQDSISQLVKFNSFVSSQKDLIIDHHRPVQHKNKKKIIRLCIIGLLVVIIISFLTILLIIFNKSQSKNKIRRNEVPPVLRWNRTGLALAGIVNQSGNANNQLNNPTDLVLDYENNLYVADTYNHRIQMFNRANLIGQTIAGNGSVGSTIFQLKFPHGLIIDSNRNLYISDTSNHRIIFWKHGDNYGQIIVGLTGTFHIHFH